PFHVERVAVPEAGVADGADVVAEEDDDARLVRIDDEIARKMHDPEEEADDREDDEQRLRLSLGHERDERDDQGRARDQRHGEHGETGHETERLVGHGGTSWGDYDLIRRRGGGIADRPRLAANVRS